MKRCEFTLVAFKGLLSPRPGLPNHRATRNSGVGFVGTSGFTNWVTRRTRSARQPIAVSDISIYICLIVIILISHSEANPKNN